MKDSDIRCVESIECQNVSPWTSQLLRDELENTQAISLVAEWKIESGLPVITGWCASRYLSPEAELLKISVHNTFRRSGIGKALLVNLLFRLQQLGVRELFLEVRSRNHTALKFYQNSGFLQVGERKGYYINPEDAALILKYEF